jgi:hypothetical protein
VRLSFGITKGRSGSTTTTPDRDLPGTAPPILAAGVIYAAAGGLALGTDGPALTMIVGVAGTGAFVLALAGGLLGSCIKRAAYLSWSSGKRRGRAAGP